MRRKEKILLLVDIVVQVLLLFFALVCYISVSESLGNFVVILVFIYQLFSCIVHQEFPGSFFRKIYHWILIPVLILCAVLIILSVMDIGFALFALIGLTYCVPVLMIYYLVLTFCEQLKTNDHDEK